MKLIKSTTVAILLTSTGIAFAHGPGVYLEQADTNKDGAVSKVEATQYAEARFSDADTNKDGAISQVEAEAIKTKHQAEFEKRAQERFASKDTNKDGKLQKSELEHMPDGMFTRLDANKDGGISADEFRARGGRHGKGPGMRHGRKGDGAPGAAPSAGEKQGHGKHGGLFEKMDTNQDGNVTKVEAKAASEQHFARLDRNSDGNITTDEMPRLRFHKGKPQAEGAK